MVKIHVEADCGNAPKKQFLKDFQIALAEGNRAFIAESITDDIIWTVVGDQPIEGRDAFFAAFDRTNRREPAQLMVDKIIAHGRDGSANGEIVTRDGKTYAFSDVYEFKHTRNTGNSIKAITSYVIEV